MLRRFAHAPATVSVICFNETLEPNSVLRALEGNQGLRIYAAPRGSNDRLSVALDIYTVEALRAAHITPLSSEKEKLHVPRYARKVMWP
ncbi:hypothetical protein FI667_g3525, partial [Globisporangium splendens]